FLLYGVLLAAGVRSRGRGRRSRRCASAGTAIPDGAFGIASAARSVATVPASARVPSAQQSVAGDLLDLRRNRRYRDGPAATAGGMAGGLVTRPRRVFLFGLSAVFALAIWYTLLQGHATPAGQPPLAEMNVDAL